MLKPGDLAFETSDFLLLLLNRVERPFEPAHPAGEALLFGLELCAASQQLCLSRARHRPWGGTVAKVDGEAGSCQAPSCSRCG